MKDGTESPQAIFDQAVTEFNSGNFERARTLFNSIRESGVTSADLELNLAKSFYKTGNIYEALVHGQAGVFLTRVDSSARTDLELMQKSVPAGYGEVMDHPAEISWKVYSYLRPAESAFFAAFLLFVFLLGAILRKSLWTRMSVILLTLAVIFAGLSIAALPAKNLAIVKTEGAELRSTPIASAEVSMKLPAGARLLIRETRGDFIKVERSNGVNGWISKEAASRLL
jgi:hypothetical protein